MTTPTLEQRVAEAMVRELERMHREDDGCTGTLLRVLPDTPENELWRHLYANVDFLPLARAALAAAGVGEMREALEEARASLWGLAMDEMSDMSQEQWEGRWAAKFARIDAALAAGQEDEP